LRVLWRQGAPLGLATLLSVAQIKADVLVLGALAAGATVGHYALAQKLGEVLLLVPVVVLDLSFAMLLRSAWPVAVQDTWLFDLASATAQGAALLNALLAPLLVGLFFGADYAAAAPLAQVLGLGAVALALDAARQRWLLRHGLQALAWRVGLLGLAVTLCLLALAVPLGGAAAAAGAMVLAGLLTSALAPRLDVRLRPLAALQWHALWPWHRLWRGRVLSGLRCVRPRRHGAAARRAPAVVP
jgi:O-antigen/teichoic acid export membrane protein